MCIITKKGKMGYQKETSNMHMTAHILVNDHAAREGNLASTRRLWSIKYKFYNTNRNIHPTIMNDTICCKEPETFWLTLPDSALKNSGVAPSRRGLLLGPPRGAWSIEDAYTPRKC